MLELMIIIGLLLLAALSPILTFSALFQQKEWRLDRLREHLRREGWRSQLLGRTRSMLLFGYIGLQCIGLLVIRYGKPAIGMMSGGFLMAIALLWIVLLGSASALQLIRRKQRFPVETAKAKMIVSLSLLLAALVTVTPFVIFMLSADDFYSMLLGMWIVLLPVFLLLQPACVLVAWAMLFPLDALLKKRVMERARRVRSAMGNVTVIGIAGSVGKTTTKNLIAHLLQDLNPLVTPEHVNTEMGIAQWLINHNSQFSPEPVEGLNSQLLVIEMGAYRKGEIALLCSIAQPTIGVMTALGSDHLALFGSEQAIDDANAELLEALPATGHAFLNGANPRAVSLKNRSKAPVTITMSEDLKPTAISETSDGLQLSIINYQLSIPLHGLHNLQNILLAIAVARHLNVSDERIAELLQTFRSSAHTFNVREERGVLLLDDTYNISPLSLKAALDWAREQTRRPRVLLTSGLQETGPEEEHHLQNLGQLAQHSVERVIFTTPHGVEAFKRGYEQSVEVLTDHTPRVAPGSVLLCVGRMPLTNVQKLLPMS